MAAFRAMVVAYALLARKEERQLLDKFENEYREYKRRVPMFIPGSTGDPVCGMAIDPKHAVGTRAVRGRTFYFCSADCLAKFDADPESMANRAPAGVSPAEHDQNHGQRRRIAMRLDWKVLGSAIGCFLAVSYALGLVETIAYGVFFGLVFAPLYNFFLVRVWRHTS